MSSYELYGRLNNYKSGFGQADKDKVKDLAAGKFDTMFFPIEDLYARVTDESANQITTHQLSSRMKRDYAIDNQNPMEKLPEDSASAMLIDSVPMFGYTHPPNLDLPSDYEQNDQVKLIQQAYLNAQKQSELYTNEDVMKDPGFNTDKVGQGNSTASQKQVLNGQRQGGPSNPGDAAGNKNQYILDGSAAGLETNHLFGEQHDEASRVTSTETMTAF